MNERATSALVLLLVLVVLLWQTKATTTATTTATAEETKKRKKIGHSNSGDSAVSTCEKREKEQRKTNARTHARAKLNENSAPRACRFRCSA